MKIFPLYNLPPISWFAAVYRESSIMVEVHQHYRKQQYTNRMRIQASNKIHTLTVPICRTGENTPLLKSTINYEADWLQDHWRGIGAAYRRSPYFEYYEDRFHPVYHNKHERLVDRNLELLKLMFKFLDLDIEIHLSEKYEGSEVYEQDFRNDFDSRAKVFPEWFSPKQYTQVFRTFETDLSILDLICNEGPAAGDILKHSYSPVE